MQGMAILLLMISAARKHSSLSSSFSGRKSSMKLRLSCICSMLLMPERTTMTLGRDVAKRMAQEGTDIFRCG